MKLEDLNAFDSNSDDEINDTDDLIESAESSQVPSDQPVEEGVQNEVNEKEIPLGRGTKRTQRPHRGRPKVRLIPPPGNPNEVVDWRYIQDQDEQWSLMMSPLTHTHGHKSSA